MTPRNQYRHRGFRVLYRHRWGGKLYPLLPAGYSDLWQRDRHDPAAWGQSVRTDS